MNAAQEVRPINGGICHLTKAETLKAEMRKAEAEDEEAEADEEEET
jgi:hypothetical protein